MRPASSQMCPLASPAFWTCTCTQLDMHMRAGIKAVGTQELALALRLAWFAAPHIKMDLSHSCGAGYGCYTEKAPNAWQRRGTQKTRNTYNQTNRPNRQTSQAMGVHAHVAIYSSSGICCVILGLNFHISWIIYGI